MFFCSKLSDMLIICNPPEGENGKLDATKQLDAIGMSVSDELFEFTEPPKDYRELAQKPLDVEVGFSIFVPSDLRVYQFFAT